MSCPEEFREVIYEKSGALYLISFLDRTIDNKNSIWRYRVEVTGDPSLSFWILGLCIHPQHDVLRVMLDGEELVENVEYELQLDTPDPLTGISGIKFEVGISSVDPPLEFSFTLAGIFAIEPVDIGVKAGSPPALIGQSICGPSCQRMAPLKVKRGFVVQ